MLRRRRQRSDDLVLPLSHDDEPPKKIINLVTSSSDVPPAVVDIASTSPPDELMRCLMPLAEMEAYITNTDFVVDDRVLRFYSPVKVPHQGYYGTTFMAWDTAEDGEDAEDARAPTHVIKFIGSNLHETATAKRAAKHGLGPEVLTFPVENSNCQLLIMPRLTFTLQEIAAVFNQQDARSLRLAAVYAARTLGAKLLGLFRLAVDAGFRHNDLHSSNLMWHEENQRWYFIDFAGSVFDRPRDEVFADWRQRPKLYVDVNRLVANDNGPFASLDEFWRAMQVSDNAATKSSLLTDEVLESSERSGFTVDLAPLDFGDDIDESEERSGYFVDLAPLDYGIDDDDDVAPPPESPLVFPPVPGFQSPHSSGPKETPVADSLNQPQYYMMENGGILASVPAQVGAYNPRKLRAKKAMVTWTRTMDLRVLDVGGGGDCLFKAVSHQLHTSPDMHRELRQATAEYIAANQRDLDDDLTDSIFRTNWRDRAAEWALVAKQVAKPGNYNALLFDIVVLPALANATMRSIVVLQPNTHQIVMHPLLMYRSLLPPLIIYRERDHFWSVITTSEVLDLNISL